MAKRAPQHERSESITEAIYGAIFDKPGLTIEFREGVADSLEITMRYDKYNVRRCIAPLLIQQRGEAVIVEEIDEAYRMIDVDDSKNFDPHGVS